MYVILMGAQGSGKGTQAAVIAPELKLTMVATGELFRAAIAARSELGLQVEAILARGDLVPDDVTNAIVRERLAGIVAAAAGGDGNGALFDGFPRNENQARALDTILDDLGQRLTVVIEIDVPREALIERLAGRRTGATSGRIFNIQGMTPEQLAAIEEELIQRDDDQPEAIARRLAIYDQQTAPLLAYYAERGLVERVNGDQPVEDVTAAIMQAIESRVAAGKAS
ncbi:MAG TPA: adenylate kinase [Thermomicrobiales bacterium]|nr:adenylate kinase [Thermomicrobiales bacterium]